MIPFERQHNPTRAVVALLMLFSLLGSLMGSPSSPASAASAALLDLAAMTLTAADLEAIGLDGYVQSAGGSATAEVPYVVQYWSDAYGEYDRIAEGLAGAGFRHRSGFSLHTDVPEPGGRYVYGSINEFADVDGAADGLAVLDEMSRDDNSIVEAIEDLAHIGEASLIVRHTQYAELVIAYQVDRLLVVIQIRDWTDVKPAIAEIQSVANRQLEKIEQGLDGDAPGLGNQVLRLASDEFQDEHEVRIDQYLRLAGDDRWFDWDSDDEYATRVEVMGDAIDAYQLIQFVQGADAQHPEFPNKMGWSSTIHRFADDQAAAEWLEWSRDHLDTVLHDRDGTEIQDVQLLDDAPIIGDESFTVAYSEVESGNCDCGTSRAIRIQARLGSFVAVVQLSTLSEQGVPLEAVEPLATYQVDCLSSFDCLDPVVLSDALSGQEPATRKHSQPFEADSHAIADTTLFPRPERGFPRWR